MLGHDVEYSTKADDSELIASAKAEERILLTRDFELYKRAVGRGVEAFYVEGSTEEERLAEIAKRFGIGLEINMETSRCPKCNTRVVQVPKKQVESEVQMNTFVNYEEFWQCPKCGQIFWRGAHWEKIGKTLEGAKKILAAQRKI
jgi:uncharacterized protein with PIN domain